MLFTLVYASHALHPFSSAEMLDLLRRAREKNTRIGVTGLLLCKEGAFMQAIEGDEETVRELYAAIRDDKRHHHVLTLLATPITKRQFADWSMGFKNLDEADVSAVPGYNPSPNLPPASDEMSLMGSVAMTLLASFQQQN